MDFVDDSAFQTAVLVQRCATQILKEEQLVERDPRTENVFSGDSASATDEDIEFDTTTEEAAVDQFTSLRSEAAGHRDSGSCRDSFDGEFDNDSTLLPARPVATASTCKSSPAACTPALSEHLFQAQSKVGRESSLGFNETALVEGVVSLTHSQVIALKAQLAVEAGRHDFDVFLSGDAALHRDRDLSSLHFQGENLVPNPGDHPLMISNGRVVSATSDHEVNALSSTCTGESVAAITEAEPPDLDLFANAAPHVLTHSEGAPELGCPALAEQVELSCIQSETVRQDLCAGFAAFLRQYATDE
eukprot:INCI11150.1.p1 GENE.INCI11150.1~~INCI11150.1.p1  ORF type:complete len:303 (+),score=55.68 INCI11150.1:106-1014(+)